MKRSGRWPTILGSALLCLTGLSSARAVEPIKAVEPIHLELLEGELSRPGRTPVWHQLPDDWTDVQQVSLVNSATGASVPVQLSEHNGKLHAVWLLDAKSEADDNLRQLFAPSRKYVLSPAADQAPAPNAVVCTNDGSRLWIRRGDAPVLCYHHAMVEPPEGMARHYRRSGYIHPLFTPSGKVVTGDFAADHPHQHGVFMAWVKTRYRDRAIDFWNQGKLTGDVEHQSIDQMISGPVFAGFTVSLRHVDRAASPEDQVVLHETWTVRVYNTDEPFGRDGNPANDERRGHLIDLISQQWLAAEHPLEIEEYHYGGMAIRGADAWLNTAQSTAGHFLTDLDHDRHKGNNTPARWVAMFGQLDGADAGVAVLGSTNNFRAPQYVRLHPNKPYFCYAPMQQGAFELTAGERYTSQYRYVVYDGPTHGHAIDPLWLDYAFPARFRYLP